MSWQSLVSTLQLIIRLGELSVFGVTEKTGLWRQSSMCSDTLDSRRCRRTLGVTFRFYRQTSTTFQHMQSSEPWAFPSFPILYLQAFSRATKFPVYSVPRAIQRTIPITDFDREENVKINLMILWHVFEV